MHVSQGGLNMALGKSDYNLQNVMFLVDFMGQTCSTLVVQLFRLWESRIGNVKDLFISESKQEFKTWIIFIFIFYFYLKKKMYVFQLIKFWMFEGHIILKRAYSSVLMPFVVLKFYLVPVYGSREKRLDFLRSILGDESCTWGIWINAPHV